MTTLRIEQPEPGGSTGPAFLDPPRLQPVSACADPYRCPDRPNVVGGCRVGVVVCNPAPLWSALIPV